ncbi:mas-related G-protein coupled receptor member H-like [Melospiza melodia melodia]|uniref:mas-related G-protein coupled receptor member H-like n=1 Tax=Melospiza melodia melodia TaxID=1914991 RepID=UPI002FD41890
MEVRTVSPSPASPTEGDDVCETDVTNVAMHSVTLLICLCGLAGNGALLCCISLKIGNHIIFQLAVVDFLLLLFTVPSAILFLVEDISCSPIVPLMYESFLFQLSVVSYYWALLWLMPTRPVVYMEKLWKLCCHCDFPLRLWVMLGTVQYWAIFALFAIIPTVTFVCPSQEQEHCRAALISMYAIILLLFVAPVVISSTIDFIKAKWSSQQQQPKRRDMVVVITVLFTLFLILCTFLMQLGYINVSPQVFLLLTCILSSIKPFIYFLVWRCWRPCSVGSLWLSPQRASEEPEENTVNRNDPTTDTDV